MGKIFSIFAVAALAGLSPAWAYIPSTSNILRKTVKTHGESAYQIEQEVQFQIGPRSHLVQEKWTVENGDTLRLEARPAGSADSWSLTVLYSGGRRYVWDEGKVKSQPLSPEFAENLFHYRQLNDMMRRLVQLQVLPQRALRSAESQQYNPEPWVRLGRLGGSISLVLGAQEPGAAGLWIEQDSFLLQRLRFNSQAELVVEENREHTARMSFPQLRRYLWNQHSVLVRTTNVTPITIGPKTRPLLSPQSLSQEKNASLPEEALIQEFYSRFR